MIYSRKEYWASVVIEWSGVEWSGVEWCGVEWSGVEWSGVEWCGVVWCGVSLIFFMSTGEKVEHHYRY